MKKELYLCGALLVAMSSCSNDASIPAVEEANNLVPVSLGLMTASADIEETRGTGTVGGTSAATNEWNYEDLYVLMTTSDPAALEDQTAEWGFASVGGAVLKEQFDNTFFARPKKLTREGVEVWNIDYDPEAVGRVKYYPSSGASQFFAYYVDDAAQSYTAGNPDYVREENSLYVPFKIDGSQDLLLGKASLLETTPVAKQDGGFSAKSARAGEIPSLSMQHQLTRLTFTLKNGNANTAGVVVKSIAVKSKSTGKMYVAYKDEPAQKMVWEDDSYEFFYLKQSMDAGDPLYVTPSLADGKNPLVAFAPITMTGDVANPQDAGEAMFVCPDAEYSMVVELEHTVMVNGTTQTEVFPLPLTLKLSSGQFEAGTSYHINATIYGYEEIILDANLEPWVPGEDVNVGSDN